MEDVPALTAFEFSRLSVPQRSAYLATLVVRGARAHYAHLRDAMDGAVAWTPAALEANLLAHIQQEFNRPPAARVCSC